MQRAEFETKLNRVCLHIYKEGNYEEDYQMPMLRQNQLDGILEVEGCEVDGKARYTYEISGLVSMKSMYENACIKKQEIEAVIMRILEVTENLQKYMLDPNCLILQPEYIFFKEGRWFFCYFPGMEEDLCRLFHELTEYFVKMLDYEDTEGIFLAYELHKATLREHYDLELIMKECRGREAERKKQIYEKQTCEKQIYEKQKPVKNKSINTGYTYNRKKPVIEDEGEVSFQEHKSEEYQGYQYGSREQEKFEYTNHGNIFSVADEDEYDADSQEQNGEKPDSLYTADTIREDSGGGWWKSWRKAANGIRRKRWGSWDDLILETDGQEEES